MDIVLIVLFVIFLITTVMGGYAEYQCQNNPKYAAYKK